MLPRTPEADATREIILGTRSKVLWFRNPVGRAVPLHSKSGKPIMYGVGGEGGADWLGVVLSTGQFIAAEFKRADGKGRTTAEQATFLAAIRAAGGIAVVARCAADVLEAIK